MGKEKMGTDLLLGGCCGSGSRVRVSLRVRVRVSN